MSDRRNLVNEKPKGKINWKRLLIILALGIVPTAICFIFGWWWAATAFMLLTLFGMCFAVTPALYPHAFTAFAFVAIAWITGSWLDSALASEPDAAAGWRAALPLVAGVTLGVVLPVLFWLVVLFVSTKAILKLSESLDISGWQALTVVASQVFDTSQNYWIVENGAITVEKPRGILSKLKGPGMLLVYPGNAVVLERGGKTTRIVGPGTHRLKRFEFIKKPADKKGIVDLSPQYTTAETEDVMTSDGIPLKITVGQGWQIEPKEVTDLRPGSHFGGGEATTPLLGQPEYAVYEAIIRKAVFRTTAWGVQAMFPTAPINILRDVIATYTLEQIFALDRSGSAAPDPRTVRRIEEIVSERFDASWAGVQYKGMDIRTIKPPKDVKQQFVERWKAPMEGQVAIQRAQAERDVLIELSEGRARSLERLEEVRLEARRSMAKVVSGLIDQMQVTDKAKMVAGFTSVFEQLTTHIGQDESVAMRYIETMQAIMTTEGPKSFIITPPNPSPGLLPAPPVLTSGSQGKNPKP